jgi:hypothetical protein
MLVDVGDADDFGKKGQLQPEKLKEAAQNAGREEGEVEVRMQEGFDHSYYFVGLRRVQGEVGTDDRFLLSRRSMSNSMPSI